MHSPNPEQSTEGAAAASEDPIAAAKALLEQEQQARTQACAAELQAVLARHGMTLEVTPAQIVLAPRA